MGDSEKLQETFAIDPQLVAGRIKAARLNKGWDILKLEKESGISRGTLYRLEKAGTENPHFSTLCKVAQALEIPPRSLTIIFDESNPQNERLPIHTARSKYDRATNPMVETTITRHPRLFVNWNEKEWDELYSSFGTGGALNEEGVIATTEAINRKRKTVEQLECILETHLADVAEELIDALFRKVRLSSVSESIPSGIRKCK